MNGGKSVGSTVGTDGFWFADKSDVAAQGSSGVLAKLRYATTLATENTPACLFVVNHAHIYGYRSKLGKRRGLSAISTLGTVVTRTVWVR